MILTALGTAGIALFQILLLRECGIIHRKLGTLYGDATTGGAMQKKIRELVGQPSLLERGSKALFVSLSCADCAALLRATPQWLASKVSIYIADRETETDVADNLKRFNYSISARPGKQIFEKLEINSLPLFVVTDENGVVSQVEEIRDTTQLEAYA